MPCWWPDWLGSTLNKCWINLMQPANPFPIGHVRYVNILTQLRGFQDKLLYLVLFSLCPSLLTIERQKKLKKFTILTWKPWSHAWISISNVAYSVLSRWVNTTVLNINNKLQEFGVTKAEDIYPLVAELFLFLTPVSLTWYLLTAKKHILVITERVACL